MKLFSVWSKAWLAAMAEADYPNAYLVPGNDEHDYAWHHDVDRFYMQEQWLPEDEVGWHVAHRAFVLVDHLRPDFIWASPQLQSLLDSGRTIKGEKL
jgi:hypothetical protein